MGQFSPAAKPCNNCEKQGSAPMATQKTFARGRFMADGSLVYPKKGFEPPPPVEGYERDKGNAWRFIPLWPDCQTRVRMLKMKKCGAYNVIMACTNTQCEHNQNQVTLQICQSCPLRQARPNS
jgi:hypothetical protein